jgi:hypothetical protein
MSNLSLLSAVRSCKVDTSYANKIQSDRFENPQLMVCPPWSGVDQAGRLSSPDGFMTKTAGCNSPGDRVIVENALRPQYIEYVNLDAQGYRGNIYDNMLQQQSAIRRQGINDISKVSGNFGSGYGAQVAPRCRNYSYSDALVQENLKARQGQTLQNAYKSMDYRVAAGV